jgi:hypothetical protein
VVVFIGLLLFDDLREAVEPLQPRADALEGVGREHAAADTADLLRRHELREKAREAFGSSCGRKVE